MKYLSICLFLIGLQLHAFAQQKVKIAPPPPLTVPRPPKPIKPFQPALSIDPFQEHPAAFRTDTIYNRTDTSLLVTQWCFAPSGTGSARLSVETSTYPKQFNKDSIGVRHDRVIAVMKDTRFWDGTYRFNKQLPKAADKLIFTDQQTRQQTVFIIRWTDKAASRKIAGLIDKKQKRFWRPGSPPANDPVGY